MRIEVAAVPESVWCWLVACLVCCTCCYLVRQETMWQTEKEFIANLWWQQNLSDFPTYIVLASEDIAHMWVWKWRKRIETLCKKNNNNFNMYVCVRVRVNSIGIQLYCFLRFITKICYSTFVVMMMLLSKFIDFRLFASGS